MRQVARIFPRIGAAISPISAAAPRQMQVSGLQKMKIGEIQL